MTHEPEVSHLTELAHHLLSPDEALVFFGTDAGRVIAVFLRSPAMVPYGDWSEAGFWADTEPPPADVGSPPTPSRDTAPLRDYCMPTRQGRLYCRAGFAPKVGRWAVMENKEVQAP